MSSSVITLANPAVDLSEMSAADLRRIFIKRRLPRSERFRMRFGRSTDMNTIEAALLEADHGIMTWLADLESEVLALDPHLSAILAKRFGSVQCLDWDLELPTGPDTDKVEAKLISEKVRQDLNNLPFFSESLYDLMWANYDGRAILETQWEKNIQHRFPWSPCELRWVHPRRISFGPERELRIVDPFNLRGDFVKQGIGVDEHPGKFLWWQPRLFREYAEREGLGPRTLYWSFFKRFSWRNRMILTELFGVPWRVVTQDKDVPPNHEDVEEAREAAEALAGESTAAFGPGMKLDVIQPNDRATEIFDMTHDRVNSEMSKLVLGQTGTTDSDANRAETIVQKGEQDIILQRDATGLSERVTHFLVRAIVILNFGKDALVNAPKFKLLAEPPRDQLKDIERVERTVALGVPVAVNQIREVSGMRKPEDDEVFVTAAAGGVDPLTGAPTGPTTQLVDPTADPAAFGEGGNTDDAADQLPTMEDEGPDGQADNAEDDLVAAKRRAWTKTLLTAAYSTMIFDTQNHGHMVMIVESMLKAEGDEGLYPIQGVSDHNHDIILDADQRARLAAGEEIEVASTPGGPDEHMHKVRLKRANPESVFMQKAPGEYEAGGAVPAAGAEQIKLPFAGFEDFEACVISQKQRDPSLSDAQARNICGKLKDSVEASREQHVDDTTGGSAPFRW